MTSQILTYVALFIVLAVSGYFFLSGTLRTLRQQRENAALKRQVEALERFEPPPSTSVGDQDINTTGADIPPNSSKRAPLAEAHRRALQRREAERLKKQGLDVHPQFGQGAYLTSGVSDRERLLITESSLDPQSEESIRLFLAKARELRISEVEEEGQGERARAR